VEDHHRGDFPAFAATGNRERNWVGGAGYHTQKLTPNNGENSTPNNWESNTGWLSLSELFIVKAQLALKRAALR
jgi:hypothetical protein